MDRSPLRLTDISYREAFPWLHLFRGFQIARDPRKLLLAAMAILALTAGELVFAQLPFTPEAARGRLSFWLWEQTLGEGAPVAQAARFLVDPLDSLTRVSTYWNVLATPFLTVLEPGFLVLRAGSTWQEIAYAWTRLLWTLAVWAVFGGAIGRIAAVQFARDRTVRLADALRFSSRRFLSFFSAPLMPLAGVGLLWLICYVLGLFGRIPAIGEVLVGLGWGLALVTSLLITVLVLGVMVGWPLMISAISTEHSDGFDGLSRAYSYVFDRPWHYAWYALVAAMYGSVLIFFVSLVAALVVYFADWGVGSGMGTDGLGLLYNASPEMTGGNTVGERAPDAPSSLGAMLVGAWMHGFALLVAGFVYSYFWTAATIIYFLLRRSDDGTDLREVWLPEEQPQREELPVVGMAAVEPGGDSSAPSPEIPD